MDPMTQTTFLQRMLLIKSIACMADFSDKTLLDKSGYQLVMDDCRW